MRGAGHVEEKPIAAPAGPIARLAPWLPTKCPAACPQHTLFFERSAMSLRTRKLGPTQRPSRGSREAGFPETYQPSTRFGSNLPKSGLFRRIRQRMVQEAGSVANRSGVGSALYQYEVSSYVADPTPERLATLPA